MKLSSTVRLFGIATVAFLFAGTQPVSAQRHGGGNKSGGGFQATGANGARFSSSQANSIQKVAQSQQLPHSFKNSQGTVTQTKKWDATAHKSQVNSKPSMDLKKGTTGKGFAKGEPNPSAPGGFKHPNNMKSMPFQKNYCWQPGYGKGYCGNWYGCYPKWNWGCGWGGYGYPCFNPCWNFNWCYPYYGYCLPRTFGTVSYCQDVVYTSPVFCATETVLPSVAIQQVSEVPLPPVGELTQSTMADAADETFITKKSASEMMESAPVVDASFIASSFVRK